MLAAERYKSVWNMFLQALNHDPTACLRAFQCEQHVNKRSMARWMQNNGLVKLLRWDTDGFTLYQKRLERGTFEIPYFNTGKKACVMPYKTLSAIMSGISLKSVRYRKRLNIDSCTFINA